jgi:hypothetical protein
VNRHLFPLLALTAACATTPSRPAPTEPAERVALLDIKPPAANDPASTELAQTLGAIVAFNLEDTGRFKVVSREDLAGLLKARSQQQLLGCETSACQTDLAKAVDVKRIVTGSLGKLGAKYVVSLNLIDTGKAEAVRRSMETVPAQEEALMAAADRSAKTLAARDEAPREGTGFGAQLSTGAAVFVGRTLDEVRGLTTGTPLEPVVNAALETTLAQGLRARLEQLRARRQAMQAPVLDVGATSPLSSP